ncbi:hypothetical protein imdm_1741 [gamma proteobacterium IMCC2047]|nr:hypothetical protein imdm_1741 [gamma proteobacterium IMCC2047]
MSSNGRLIVIVVNAAMPTPQFGMWLLLVFALISPAMAWLE